MLSFAMFRIGIASLRNKNVPFTVGKHRWFSAVAARTGLCATGLTVAKGIIDWFGDY